MPNIRNIVKRGTTSMKKQTKQKHTKTIYSKYVNKRVDTHFLANGMHPVCVRAMHKRDASRVRAQRH